MIYDWGQFNLDGEEINIGLVLFSLISYNR